MCLALAIVAKRWTRADGMALGEPLGRRANAFEVDVERDRILIGALPRKVAVLHGHAEALSRKDRFQPDTIEPLNIRAAEGRRSLRQVDGSQPALQPFPAIRQIFRAR